MTPVAPSVLVEVIWVTPAILPNPALDAAHREAELLYGEDDEAEVRAFAAGTHPLQRTDVCSAAGREESMRSAVDGLARGSAAGVG